jgi:hypothetical protein
MRLVIQDATGTVIYERFGMSGNGTYTIPASAIGGPVLDALKISVFDFNCTTSACTTSTVAVSASRSVVYMPRALTAGPSCAIGSSVRVDFAPNNCMKLDVAHAVSRPERVELFPNPATSSATLKFRTATSGQVQLVVTDMLGKIVYAHGDILSSGAHQHMINVSGWAKGMYFLNISNASGEAPRMKLVVE